MTRRQRRFLFWGSATLFMVIVLPVVLYSFGYRFSLEEFEILRAGGLFIRSLPATGTRISIDGKFVKETNLLSRTLFLQGLTPRTYHIKIEKDTYFSWEKAITVLPERVAEVHALLIPEQPAEGIVLAQGNYKKMAFADSREDMLVLTDTKKRKHFYSLDEHAFIPTPIETATSTRELPAEVELLLAEKKPSGYAYDPSGERIVWWNDNTIWIRWLRGVDFLPYYTEEPEALVYKTTTPIYNVQFYPGQEAIIAAYANAIVVIELDGRDLRNMYPLYKGKEPYFELAANEKKVYLLDDGNFMSIQFP